MKIGDQWGPATVMTVALVIVVAVFGGLVLLFGDNSGPDGLTFDSYLDALSTLAIGVGALGIGRGIMKSRR